MRVGTVSCALAVLVPCLACSDRNKVTGGSVGRFSVPTAVNCADAPMLTQRAAEDRHGMGDVRSDQEKLLIGSRANFVAALALLAELKCRVVPRDADDALKPALEAARMADATDGFYEKAHWWSEAGFIATQVVRGLIQQLPASTLQ